MNVKLSFEEAIEGVEKTLFINKKRKCSVCQGSKCFPGTLPSKCWGCYGKGLKITKIGPHLQEEKCPKCLGSGLTIKKKC